jgi:hypothetical protein
LRRSERLRPGLNLLLAPHILQLPLLAFVGRGRVGRPRSRMASYLARLGHRFMPISAAHWSMVFASLELRGHHMKIRTLAFVTAMALSSTLAFAQGGGGGGGGGSGSGGGAGGASGGSASSSGVGSSVGSSIGGPSDVTTSGGLDRGATEPLDRSTRDRSNTGLTPSDPRIGENPRNARASINKVPRSDRNSVINRNRW